MTKAVEPLIFELSRQGRQTALLPPCDVPKEDLDQMIPVSLRRKIPARLPEVSEIEMVRHFTRLSKMNYGVEDDVYPLGSCTMKYNPKMNEAAAQMPGFERIHPLQPAESVQGCLELMYGLERMLCEITGMDRFSLVPAAGAHGELAGLMMIRAWHDHRGDFSRRKIIVPDSAHGTNPASATMAGFDIIEVRSDDQGGIDVQALRDVTGTGTAGLMLTNPNTLGLFDSNILEISKIVHEAGGLLYYDGANANAILGITRPGDMEFDIVHLNLHKTFGTPHGGGGPGSGPVGVRKSLEAFLPVPLVEKRPDGTYVLTEDRPLSIGRIKSFHGHFAVLVRAYAYILNLGASGLRRVACAAVLNANYLKYRLEAAYQLPYHRRCMHEVVFSGLLDKDQHISTLDVAKRLLDYGFHPPTIYFPLIVKEAMMIEPTETESVESLDRLVEAMIQIAGEAVNDPEMLRHAPHKTIISRPDEVRAARQPILRHQIDPPPVKEP